MPTEPFLSPRGDFHMKRNAMNAAIAAILFAGLAMAGCNRDTADDATATDTTPPPADTTAPPGTDTGMDTMDTPPTGPTVTTVDPGSATGAGNRPPTPTAT